MPMLVRNIGDFLVGTPENPRLTEKDREALLALANEELEEELIDLMDEADRIAKPVALFAVCPVEAGGIVNGVTVGSTLVEEKLQGKGRAIPYIATCGRELEAWSEQYRGDYLCEFWADEIKKRFLMQGYVSLREYLKETYRVSGHMAALNPGSLPGWPISGQKELFRILGGPEYVRDTIGVTYSDSFLMTPTKSISGILFESETFYENCQHCPLERCPNRRAKRID